MQEDVDVEFPLSLAYASVGLQVSLAGESGEVGNT